MSQWYLTEENIPLSKRESDGIERFKDIKLREDLLYIYEYFKLEQDNKVYLLTSFDEGVVKINTLQKNIRLVYEDKNILTKKLNQSYIELHDIVLHECKYVKKDIPPPPIRTDENMVLGPERVIKKKFTSELQSLFKSDSNFFEDLLTRLKKKPKEYLLDNYVFCFTGISAYSTRSELVTLIRKFGGRYIRLDDIEPRPIELYANKKFPGKKDFEKLSEKGEQLILLRGYDPDDASRFQSNPIQIDYPYLTNSKDYKFFVSSRKKISKDESVQKHLIIDEAEFLSALDKERIFFEKPYMETTCPVKAFFSDSDREVISWIQTIHGFGGRGVNAFRLFSSLKFHSYIPSKGNETREEKIKHVFEQIKTASTGTYLKERVEFAKTKLINGIQKLTAGFIEGIEESLKLRKEDMKENGVLKSSQILGSYIRNKHSNKNYPCGDIDVLLTCDREEDKSQCISEYYDIILDRLTPELNKCRDQQNAIEQAVVPIDNGKKFRKFVVVICKDGDLYYIRMDVKVALHDSSEYHTMKMHQTGSSVFNTIASNAAIQKNMKLSQLGLFDNKTSKYIEITGEDEILSILFEKEFAKFYTQPQNRNKEKATTFPNMNPKLLDGVPK